MTTSKSATESVAQRDCSRAFTELMHTFDQLPGRGKWSEKNIENALNEYLQRMAEARARWARRMVDQQRAEYGLR